MEKFLKELNSAQYEAVVNIKGPSLVIAGAGSGKTRVLTYRVAYLISQSVYPSQILCLTFTNKAAREMKERIAIVVGEEQAKHVWMGTFHSIFARILRIESEWLGYPSTYTIYDTIDSKSLIKSIIREMNLDDQRYKPGEVLGRISWAKNNLITPQAYKSHNEITASDNITKRPQLGDIYQTYCIRCKKSGAMDFDDLLLNTNILFRDFPQILAKYQEKFRYILVDEYQDTNHAQYLIVNKLAARHHNVCVVGDDAQSIYSFRGARIENILNFRNDYKDHSIFKLEQNYRSTRIIVDAANSLIAKNVGQIKKNVFSENEAGQKIKVVKCLTDIEEGFFVSNSILDCSLTERQMYSDFAILYRTNAQSRIFEEALRKRNIPYRVYGGISFYQRKEIKDTLAYLRLSVNHNDDEAFKRIVNYPSRGIGDVTLERLEEYAARTEKSMMQSIVSATQEDTGLNKGTLTKLKAFYDMITGFTAKIGELNAFEAATHITITSGIRKDLYNGTTPEERSRYENLEELLNGIKDFTETAINDNNPSGMADYLENVSLITDLDNDNDDDRNKVTIMTMHSAKGLEFNNVYIAGVEEELFPSRMAFESPEEMEEERRLFYVAITRAKKRVFISFAQNRYKWGTPTMSEPSRFLRDIDIKYLELPPDQHARVPIRGNDTDWDADFHDKSKYDRNGNGQTHSGNIRNKPVVYPGPVMQRKPVTPSKPADPSFKPDNPDLIQTGMKIEHATFGQGKVLHIEGVSPNRKATVFFQDTGEEKQLLLKFAKLRILK
ncbi:MAG TPA: UvrD-helicase domain-containing protein [Bacteroidales bacterium]|nr:UvrD-helicase domain-containing protein [Bacteroidales bacterium]